MKALLQRVSWAEVHVDGSSVGRIEKGLLVFLGVCRSDTKEDCKGLVEKISQLRIFSNGEGKFDLSVLEVGGSILVVSQFTLYGDSSKGRRPNFQEAAPPDQAKEIYETFLAELKARSIPFASGQFQASMDVSLCNDGPVTLMIDYPNPKGKSS